MAVRRNAAPPRETVEAARSRLRTPTHACGRARGGGHAGTRSSASGVIPCCDAPERSQQLPTRIIPTP
eukprot:4326752-Prymnesium_polylepis.1